RFDRTRDLEVIASAAEIDDARVVRVFQNSHEHAIAEALGIVAKQLARMATHFARANRLVAGREIVDRSAHEIESFVAGPALTGCSDPRFHRRKLDDHRRRLGCGLHEHGHRKLASHELLDWLLDLTSRDWLASLSRLAAFAIPTTSAPAASAPGSSLLR